MIRNGPAAAHRDRLGTTNSVAAALVGGRPQTEDPEATRPPVVAFQGWISWSERPRRTRPHAPQAHRSRRKRLMGRRFDSREAMDARRMAYRSRVSDWVLVGLGDHNFTPVDISAVILKAVRRTPSASSAVRSRSGHHDPAHFAHAQRRTPTRRSSPASNAWLIHEPTAAAAYAYEKSRRRPSSCRSRRRHV